MHNKKVYLAKSDLASGFDVEYVKSNLLRIPGIEIVEYASGITADQCDCVVIVPEEGLIFEECDELILGRAAATAINDFILEHPTGNSSNVYIYTGTIDSGNSDGDCEFTTPRALYCDDFEPSEDPTFSEAGVLYFSSYNDCSLLEYVSDDAGIQMFAWKKIQRHYKPVSDYALPNIPSIEERKSAKSAKFISPEKEYAISDRRRLLSVRKKRKS